MCVCVIVCILIFLCVSTVLLVNVYVYIQCVCVYRLSPCNCILCLDWKFLASVYCTCYGRLCFVAVVRSSTFVSLIVLCVYAVFLSVGIMLLMYGCLLLLLLLLLCEFKGQLWLINYRSVKDRSMV